MFRKLGEIVGVVIGGIIIVGIFAGIFTISWKAGMVSLILFFGYAYVSGSRQQKRDAQSGMTGRDFELYTAQCLKKKGYRNVQVTPASGDYGADIIAVTPTGEKICFQCKRYSKPVGIKAVQEISSARSYYGCSKAAVVSTASYTPAAANLASVENVALLDIAYFE